MTSKNTWVTKLLETHTHLRISEALHQLVVGTNVIIIIIIAFIVDLKRAHFVTQFPSIMNFLFHSLMFAMRSNLL